LATSSLTVAPGDVGNRTYFPLGWNLVPGTAYRMQQSTSGVSMFRVSTGTLPYPYTIPGVISITGSAAGTSFWYWGFDWQILTGCPGPRVACTGVVNPADSIVATPGGATLCAGDSIAIAVTSLDSTYDYLWVPSSGISDSTSASVFANPTLSTTYIVYAESPFNGCKTTDTLTINVNQLPVGVLTPTDTLICIGDTSMLSFSYIPVVSVTDTNDVAVPDGTPAGISTFMTISGGPTFITPTSFVSVCFNMTHTWDGDMSFTLISPGGTSLDLCSGNGGSSDNFFSTCFTPGAVTNITAGAAPFTGNWIPEGAGGLGVFNGENSNGIWELHMADAITTDVGVLLDWSITLNNGPASWTWSSDPVGFTSTADTIYVTPDTTTTYTVTLQDSTTGCTQDYSWTLNVNPPLSVDIFPANPAVCPGDSIALVAVATGGDGAINYNWTTSGVLFSVFTVTPASDETHIVMITDGCTTPAVYDTVFVDVTDSLAFTVSADTTICEGQTVTLTAVVTVGGGSYFYSWTPGGDTTASISVAPSGTTTYTVNITDNCGNSGTGSVTVTVIPLPVASFTYLPASPEAGMAVDFTSTSTGATTYAWDFGGLGTSTIANPSFTFPTAGSVDVTLIVSNSCGSDTSTQSISILVGGSEPLAAGSAVVYPNPNTGSFSLGLSGLRVTNMVGQIIWTGQASVQGREMTMPISLNAPSGVYLLEVRSGDDVARFNVTVQQ
jgi:subtilisin-like proprotein convertase family protein